ncbi:hypothetical protein FRC0505_02333 [Corynebacterium diphtheriae]|nr:hypothetical protein FRC0505_02333 [Corynebacterium diphtheriae]
MITDPRKVAPGLPSRQPGHPAGRLAAMDETTVMQMLELMDEELVFEWSYQLRCDPRPQAQELYELVRGFLAQSFM